MLAQWFPERRTSLFISIPPCYAVTSPPMFMILYLESDIKVVLITWFLLYSVFHHVCSYIGLTQTCRKRLTLLWGQVTMLL